MLELDHEHANAIAKDKRGAEATHWFDFICPYCYIAQARNDILEASGVRVIERPFQAHPEIPAGGTAMGRRVGPMYDRLEAEARRCDLPLHWPDRLPNSRMALGVAEWVRIHAEPAASALRKRVFEAHFVRGQDIGDPALVEDLAEAAGVDRGALRDAIASGAAEVALADSERLGREVGVTGTPVWLIQGQLIVGLESAAAFERVASQMRSS